jgi:fructose-bisphosphate aldolase class 1
MKTEEVSKSDWFRRESPKLTTIEDSQLLVTPRLKTSENITPGEMSIGMASNERAPLATTQNIVAKGNGILTMHESNPTCNKRFAAQAGIIPGIKVDMGAKDLAGHPGEKITEGLDGLRERLAEYLKMGARFAKWRTVFAIGDYVPSRSCIKANAHGLARYAALFQEAGLVPIVEPEVLMRGEHTQERCLEITREVLRNVFIQLNCQRVILEGLILKHNMVLSGLNCPVLVVPSDADVPEPK